MTIRFMTMVGPVTVTFSVTVVAAVAGVVVRRLRENERRCQHTRAHHRREKYAGFTH
jgi:hypothetical protein